MNNFYVYAFYHNPGHDGSLYDCFFDSMARLQSVDDKAVFVSDANAHHSESQSLLLIDMGVMVLIFVICRVVKSWCAVLLTFLVIGWIL